MSVTPGRRVGSSEVGTHFVDAERRLSAVDVSLSPGVEIGVPRPLGIQLPSGAAGQSYDVATDGRRFVVLRRANGSSKLIVTVDWQRPAAVLK